MIGMLQEGMDLAAIMYAGFYPQFLQILSSILATAKELAQVQRDPFQGRRGKVDLNSLTF